ncbi:MAG TPA: HAD family hydrolase [Minicystis sp.]|nr:HAD family hydrolase [Minicystis sp.]
MDAALLDVDGTLIDDNLLHVLAWCRAFARIGIRVAAVDVLHRVGMGGDRLVPDLLGPGASRHLMERARAFHAEEYTENGLIELAEPLPGAADLVRELKRRGLRVALASSAKQEELERYLGLLGGVDIDAIVTQEEVATTKPAPDVFARALEQLGGPAHAVVFGDTVYDVRAARKLGLPCVALLSGGIERRVLEAERPAALYVDAADACAHLDDVLRLRAAA